MEKSEIQKVISEVLQGVTYKAQFLPQSTSRNKNEKNPTLNWIITLSHGNTSWSFDYQQGIANLPDYNHSESRLVYYNKYVKQCVETGKYIKNFSVKTHTSPAFQKQTVIPAPDFVDILYCCIMDSDVLEAGSFEEWADNFGYDKDSRSAEKTYQECLKGSLKFVNMIGYDAMAKLREAYQDY